MKIDNFQADDEDAVPTRGHHGVPFPWFIPDNLRKSEQFLKSFLGKKLFGEYKELCKKTINFDGSLNRGDFALSILEFLPLITFNSSIKEEGEKLGISLPTGERPLKANPSVAYSETPTYINIRKAFFLFDEKKLIEDDNEEFFKIQKLLPKNKLRAFIVDQEEVDTNPGLWYTDEQVKGLLSDHLSDENKFTVSAPAANVFDDAHLLKTATQNAMQAAIAGTVVVMPIHLHGNHWVGAVFRVQKVNENITKIQVIFNNPQGYIIDLESNAVAFVETIQAVAQEIAPGVSPTIIDLHFKQQLNGNDCGPFMVDTLIKLATTNGLENLTERDAILAKVSLLSGNANTIRNSHNGVLSILGLPIPTANDDMDD